jgi:hypothetical protein
MSVPCAGQVRLFSPSSGRQGWNLAAWIVLSISVGALLPLRLQEPLIIQSRIADQLGIQDGDETEASLLNLVNAFRNQVTVKEDGCRFCGPPCWAHGTILSMVLTYQMN